MFYLFGVIHSFATGLPSLPLHGNLHTAMAEGLSQLSLGQRPR